MFSDKRRTLLTLAVLLVAIALAAVPTFTPFGNKQTNKCMGYNKSRPGSTQKSLSAGSCADTPSNSVTLWNANGKGGPIVDQKNKRCVTSASNKPGASVDGKQCKAVPRKGGRRRRDDGEDSKDGDVPDFLLNPENYEWPPQQQWFKISNTSTEFSTSEIWKNGYDLCLQVTKDGFFRQYKCDPNNPDQNWFINYEPQPETPPAPEIPVQPVIAPVETPVQPPPQPTGCTPRNCPNGQSQDPVTCECICGQVTCPAGKVQQADCSCECPANTCPSGQVQQDDCSCKCPNTCPAGKKLNDDCSCTCDSECPAGKKQNPADCSCTCDSECPAGKKQNPADCSCMCETECPAGKKQNQADCSCSCPSPCLYGMVQQPDCSCKCPNSCGANETQDPNTCACIKNCNKTCDPACQRLDQASCTCICTVHCVIGKVQDPNTCSCYDPCDVQCSYPQICNPDTRKCE